MSEQTLPDHLKRLNREISEKDLLRLAELERNGRPYPTVTAAADQVADGTPWVDEIEIDRRRPTEAAEVAPEDGSKLLSSENLVVAGTVGVFTVGMILESYYRQFCRLKRAYQRQSVLMRGLESVALALAILAVIGYGVAREAKAYIEARQGPFLQDALVAPYNLDERPVSNATQSQALIPALIGSYLRTDQPITRSYPSSPTNQCLLGLEYDRDIIDPPTCVRRYGALNVAAGHYLNEWKAVDLAVARFPNDLSAEATMFDLLHHARNFGQVGNYAIGTGSSVDYFYSSVRGWFSFTWSQGPWIFSVSGPKLSYIEAVIEHYVVPQSDPVNPGPGA